jgi:hypothetical protein
VRGATPPVDAQILDQERGGDQTRAITHEALAGKLTQGRIHNRIAGAAGLPSLERSRIDTPSVAARPVVHTRDGRKSQRHLMVEIAPAELTYERVGTSSIACMLDDLAHRDTAEVYIGTET